MNKEFTTALARGTESVSADSKHIDRSELIWLYPSIADRFAVGLPSANVRKWAFTTLCERVVSSCRAMCAFNPLILASDDSAEDWTIVKIPEVKSDEVESDDDDSSDEAELSMFRSFSTHVSSGRYGRRRVARSRLADIKANDDLKQTKTTAQRNMTQAEKRGM